MELLSKIKNNILLNIIKISGNKTVKETTNINDIGLDSLQLCEIIFDIEENYNVTLPINEIDKFHSVNDLINFVYEHTK